MPKPYRKRPGSQASIFCEVCSIELNCDAQAQQHISGKNHLKKLRIRQAGGMPLQTPLANPDGIKAPDFLSRGPTAALTSSDKDVPPPPTGETDPVGNAVMANMMGTLPKKRKIVEIPCAVCAMVFNNEQSAVDHYASDRHARKLKVIQQYNGTIIENNLPLVSTDTGGFVIQEKVVAIPEVPVQEDPVQAESSTKSKDTKGGTFYCHFCEISCNSMQSLETHKAGAKHRKKLAKIADNVAKPADAPASDVPQGGVPATSEGTTSGNAATTTTNGSSTGKPGAKATSWGQYKNMSSAGFQCRACKIFFNGPSELHKHLGSKEHTDKLAELTGESPKP